jgi:peptidyl-prolyl cis-trans isomerase SurA
LKTLVIAKYRRLIALSGACALALSLPVLAAPGKPPAKPAAATAGQQKPPAGGDELAAAQAESAAHSADGVAAIVNDSVISTYDLRQRMALFIATSGGRAPSDAEVKEIREQVLKQLETERLELLEAQKNDVTVSSEDVDAAIGSIVKDNHLSMDQLKTVLGHAGVQMATLRAEIATQIAWAKAVQGQYGDRVQVSKEEVDAEMGRIAAGKDKVHFAVSEIFESVDTPEQEAKVQKDMESLETQLQQGASFSAIARQFSQNPTAAKGGDMGVVQEGQVPNELYQALNKMHIGEISAPIRSVGGFYILALRDRQEGMSAKVEPVAPPPDPNPTSLPLARILLPIGPKPSAQLLDGAGKAAMALREHIANCEMAPEVAKAMKGVQFFNLGMMRLADLSAALQSQIKSTQPGGVSVPFQSAAGIELIIRCDKAPPRAASKFTMPERKEVENQLFEDKMAVFSRQYMRDLRRNADVEAK